MTKVQISVDRKGLSCGVVHKVVPYSTILTRNRYWFTAHQDQPVLIVMLLLTTEFPLALLTDRLSNTISNAVGNIILIYCSGNRGGGVCVKA